MLYKHPNREQVLANSTWLFGQDVQIITYHTTTPSPHHPQILERKHHALILPKYSKKRNFCTDNDVLFRTSASALSTDAALITLLDELEQLIGRAYNHRVNTTIPEPEILATLDAEAAQREFFKEQSCFEFDCAQAAMVFDCKQDVCCAIEVEDEFQKMQRRWDEGMVAELEQEEAEMVEMVERMALVPSCQGCMGVDMKDWWGQDFCDSCTKLKERELDLAIEAEEKEIREVETRRDEAKCTLLKARVDALYELVASITEAQTDTLCKLRGDITEVLEVTKPMEAVFNKRVMNTELPTPSPEMLGTNPEDTQKTPLRTKLTGEEASARAESPRPVPVCRKIALERPSLMGNSSTLGRHSWRVARRASRRVLFVTASRIYH